MKLTADRSSLLQAKAIYLVGIKGVAMTALAACLVDAGLNVAGCDTEEAFVTEPQLERLKIKIDHGFDQKLPTGTDLVVFTAAHGGQHNPVVVQARASGISCLSHAEALGELFNQKHGIAVCGVGGKSTTSAMIAWMLMKNPASQPQSAALPSYAVGVGEIMGLPSTGRWQNDSQYFVAEADEYVTDPSAPERGEPITPRFSYLQPKVIICTNLKFDHPDVYRDFDHTTQVFETFFKQLKPGGHLVVNGDDQPLVALATRIRLDRPDIFVTTFGLEGQADFQWLSNQPQPGLTQAEIHTPAGAFQLKLRLPGTYNGLNALAALAAVTQLGFETDQMLQTLAEFQSTKRRAEAKGEKGGVVFFDDYAHHPSEVAQVIEAYREWYPSQRLVVAFQSHTYSRTKALFDDFVGAFSKASEVVMIDIFPSARESLDPTVTSDQLCQAIHQRYPEISCQNLHTIEALATWCQTELHPGDVFITLGAGDLYQVHDLISAKPGS